MPELPEVETVVRGLREVLPGHKIIRIDFDWAKSYPNSQAQTESFVFGHNIIDVRRKAKTIIIDLDSDYSLIVHLKMTGQLVYVPATKPQSVGEVIKQRFGGGHPNDSLVSRLPDKSTRVEFDLDNGAKLFFNDTRKFGWVRLIPTLEVDQIDFMKKLGPDALNVKPKQFIKSLENRKKAIKACLLDQTIIAGCGNIYADESLWLAKIHPQTPANKLNQTQLKKLLKDLKSVLILSLDKGGSSNRNYVNAKGEKGSYLEFANVYGRVGQACNRCGQEISRIVVASRGTHLCKACQKEIN